MPNRRLSRWYAMRTEECLQAGHADAAREACKAVGIFHPAFDRMPATDALVCAAISSTSAAISLPPRFRTRPSTNTVSTFSGSPASTRTSTGSAQGSMLRSFIRTKNQVGPFAWRNRSDRMLDAEIACAVERSHL